MRTKFNIIICVIAILAMCSCMKEIRKNDFNDESISGLIKIKIEMPEGHSYPLSGMTVFFSDPSTGMKYSSETDEQGYASTRVAFGTYIASTEAKFKASGGIINIINGTSDRIRITPEDGSASATLKLNYSRSGQIIIKEIYYGGCLNTVTNKGYSKDQYFTLYNNSSEVAYLDSLCVGVVHPWNAPSNGKVSDWVKPGTTELRDSIPCSNIGWMFDGKGKDIPLNPGEEIVVCLNGVDHTATVPNSVNLGVPGYYALYHPLYTKTQSVPNAGVIPLNGFWKAGNSTAYIFSIASPGLFIFSLGGNSIEKFISDCYTVNPKTPSNRNNDCLLVDKNLILDAVECFRNTTDSKRFRPENDNGYIRIPSTNSGYSVHRKIDEQATEEAGGRIVYMDTNNSTNDFYVRDKAVLTGK